MAPGDQPDSTQRETRARADTVGLAVAAFLWLLIQGYCAICILRQPGAVGGGVQAALVMGVPLILLVGGWALLRRVSARWRDSVGSALWFNNGLLVLALALGVASVWLGESHIRAAHEAAKLAATRPAGPQAGRAPALAVQAARTSYTFAVAGGLLELGVVTLGVALCRDRRFGRGRSGSLSA